MCGNNMKSIKVLIIFFAFFSALVGQEKQNISHPFSNSWVITGEGGITIGGTDFPDIKIDYSGRGSFEYFLPTSSSSVFGIRLLAGGGYVAGQGLSSAVPEYINIDEFRTKIVYGGAGLVYSLSLGEIVQPYLFAGVAYMIFDPLMKDGNKMPRNAAGDYADDDKDFMGEMGIRFLISNRFSLNVSYTLNYLINDNIDDIWNSKDDAFHSIFGGVSYYVFSSSDEDGDGIKDSKDMCEKTPEGVVVDEFGCPLDSDSDKVPDYLDLCSETPKIAVVDSNGCPVDLDNDGVADYRDKCPETDENIIVDKYGCEKIIVKAAVPKVEEKELDADDKLSLVLSGTANFQIGQSALLPNPMSGLEKLSDYIKVNPDTRWIIEGHTDNVGLASSNNKLSLDRAKSVLYYFQKKGINKDRFEVIGSGSSKPIADNSIEFGRILNRRVLIQEENSFREKNQLIKTVNTDEYKFSKEYNIESLIFTDGKYYCIQVSSWKTKSIAEQEIRKLLTKGHSAFFVYSKPTHKKEEWYRVRIGYFDGLEEAKGYLKRIR